MKIYLSDKHLSLPFEYGEESRHRIRIYCATIYGIAVTEEQCKMISKAYHMSIVTEADSVDIGDVVTCSEDIMVYNVPFGFSHLEYTNCTGFDSGNASKIIFETLTQLCGNTIKFILASRKIFIYGKLSPYMKLTIEMMIRYFEYVAMDYDTRNDVETNDACLAYLHQNLSLDYVEFFNQLMIEWNILIKDTDYLPAKRIIEHVLLNMVDNIQYDLYCQEADSKNWYRQDLYKQQEEAKNKENKEIDEMAGSNEEMLKSMARIHELIGDTNKEKEEESNTSVEEETSIEAYYNYTVEEEPKLQPKKSSLGLVLFHMIFQILTLSFFILSIISVAHRILLFLGFAIVLLIYVLSAVFLIYKDK